MSDNPWDVMSGMVKVVTGPGQWEWMPAPGATPISHVEGDLGDLPPEGFDQVIALGSPLRVRIWREGDRIRYRFDGPPDPSRQP